MIYSVWNQGARQYDYYNAPTVQNKANTPIPKHIRAKPLGETIDQAVWPLPSSAVKVGSGEFAKGRIASRSSNQVSLGLFSLDTNTVTLVGLGVVAFFIWKGDLLKP